MTKQGEQSSVYESPTGAFQIDTHIHLWNLSIYKRRDWLQDKQQLIRDFTPVHAAQEFATCGIAYGIVIEAAKYSVTDNLEWLRVAQSSPILLGAVPGCYLDDPGLSNLLDQYSKWDSFLAVRASPTQHSEKWHDLSPIEGGLYALSDRGVPLEILTDADGLFDVAQIAEKFPDLTVIINHCGLPGPNSVDKGRWTEAICSLGEYPNIFVKYSGFAMLTKGDIHGRFTHAVAKTLLDTFGSGRLLWGSNWPVDSLWAGYRDDWELSRRSVPEDISTTELEQIYGQTALRAYKIGTIQTDGDMTT